MNNFDFKQTQLDLSELQRREGVVKYIAYYTILVLILLFNIPNDARNSASFKNESKSISEARSNQDKKRLIEKGISSHFLMKYVFLNERDFVILNKKYKLPLSTDYEALYRKNGKVEIVAKTENDCLAVNIKDKSGEFEFCLKNGEVLTTYVNS